MKSIKLAVLSILAFSVLAAGSRSPVRVWMVYAPRDLDSRLVAQLGALAVQEQALVRIVQSPPAAPGAVPPGSSLTLELRQEANVDAFLNRLKTEAPGTALAPNEELAAEGYILEVASTQSGHPYRLRITAATPWGFHNALLRVPDLLTLAPSALPQNLLPHPQAVRIGGDGASAVIADFPSFPERGVVEGFYGPPWTHQDRLAILSFEGAHHMNVYYYAPKDDPYHRRLWRDDYPPDAYRRLGELVQAAHRNFVEFCFAISPGLTMTYSSEHDFQVLTHKLDAVSKLGVTCFALFLDDVPQNLQDPQDIGQFKTLAQAHVYLTNKLYRFFKDQSPANHLTLTPTTYTNEWGNRDYVKELGPGVDPGVSIVWTGPKTFSPAITVSQAHEWGGYLHRPPLIWDNFPVNDGTPWSRYLGPLVGRDPNLPGAVQGLFSNPMIEPHASMIPLETIADYLWNATAYDPVQSETHTVVSQYGKDAYRQLAPFLKTYGTYYWDDGNFTALFKERRYPIDVGRMRSQIVEMNQAFGRLRFQRRLEPLLREISPAVRRASERLAEVEADPAFRHLPDGRLQWNENYDALSAYHLGQPPVLNGDFSKWQSGPVYRLDERTQVATGARLWRSPRDLSARVALAWDAAYLYVGVDVTDPRLYQPYFARGIQGGGTFLLRLETGFRKNFLAKEPTGDEYALYFSPGDFAGVQPSIFSDEDYLPPRSRPHNYMQEIHTAWKKTAGGYSGDIAIPASFFEGGKLTPGYEIGLGFSAVRVFRPHGASGGEEPPRIVLQSKKDRLFHVTTSNPSSFPRLVLSR